jgi:hypothetical protein
LAGKSKRYLLRIKILASLRNISRKGINLKEKKLWVSTNPDLLSQGRLSLKNAILVMVVS